MAAANNDFDHEVRKNKQTPQPARTRVYCVGVAPFCIVLVLFFMLLLVWTCCRIFSSLMCCLCIALMVYIFMQILVCSVNSLSLFPLV